MEMRSSTRSSSFAATTTTVTSTTNYTAPWGANPTDRKVSLPTFPSSLPTSMNSRSRTLSHNNMSDFEDIGLEEDIGIRVAPRRPQIRTINTALAIPPSAVPTSKKTRELVSQRPPLPTIHSTPGSFSPTTSRRPTTPNDPNNFLRLPVKTSRKRSSKSPTRIPVNPTPQSTSPRPVSPRSQPTNPLPPRSRALTSPTIDTNGEKRPSRPPVRTSSRVLSWQQIPRKTIEQMEKECDEDSGDDVPDETVFWNVPLSPRAGRIVSSNSPSPERLSRPINDTRRASLASITLKNSPPRSTMKYSLSTTSLPVASALGSADGTRGRRGKSWGDVIQELGDEAKDLTNALERHADLELEEQEKKLQQNVAVVRKRDPSPSKPNDIMALPPKQIINTTVDPLPISKEKEAAMSRTRPTWLPPKSKEEERKHLKQYQEMMRLSLEAERKRIEKEKVEAASREQNRTSVHRIWDEKIIPNWATMIQEKSTRELWWRGISPRSRGMVWMRAFGNALKVSEETFNIALERAKGLDMDEATPAKVKKSINVIKRDVDKTLVELKLFQKGCPMHEGLLDVLMAYAEYRKDIGYVFGLHVIAANLLLNLSPSQSFIALANILNRPLPLSFYSQDEGGMTRIYSLFLRAFQYKLPRLHHHIHVKLCLPPPVYLEPMLSTLFALHVPLDIVSRLWDVFAFEGDPFLIRAAIAVLTVLEGRLYGTKDEVVSLLGWNGGEGGTGSGIVVGSEWRLGNEDDFMLKVRGAGKEEAGLKAT